MVMARGAASVRSGAGRIHGSDALFPGADILLLTGLTKGAVLAMYQQIETAL